MSNIEPNATTTSSVQEVLNKLPPNIWRTTSVEETPQVTLARWGVKRVKCEVDEKVTTHFIGWNKTENEGRVSSNIVSFDKKTMRGVTESGRVYQLFGNPGQDSDALHTWRGFCIINSVLQQEDVTKEFEND